MVSVSSSHSPVPLGQRSAETPGLPAEAQELCLALDELTALEWRAHSPEKAKLLGRKELLTFNEPNEANQANCTPARAAAVWKKEVEPLREQGWRVGAPAVNTGGFGMAWMLDWWRECNGSCRPDFLAVHFVSCPHAEVTSGAGLAAAAALISVQPL